MATLNRSSHHDTLIDAAVKRMQSLPFGVEPVEHVGESVLQAGVGFYGPTKEHVGHAFRAAAVLAGTKGAVTLPADYGNSSPLARRLLSRCIAAGHSVRPTPLGTVITAGGPTKTQPKATYARTKKEQPSYPDLVLHAAKVLNDPLDNTAILSLTDHLNELHPDHPAVNAFTRWVSNPGTPFTKDEAKLFKNSKFVTYVGRTTNGLRRGIVAVEPTTNGVHDTTGFHKTAGKSGKWKITVPPANPTEDWYVPTDTTVDSKEAVTHILNKGGVDSLLHVLIGLRMFHPKREDGAVDVTKPTLNQIRFSRVNYSGVTRLAHPLVRNFRIEHALRRLSTDENATDTVRQLATTALYGDPDNPDNDNAVTGAVHALHDALQESDHPLKTKLDRKGKTLGGYNWLRASYKLHHDAAVSHAINVLRGPYWAADEPNREYVNAFPAMRDFEKALTSHLYPNPDIRDGTPPSALALEVVNTLRAKGLKDRDIRESLHRVKVRAHDTLDRFGYLNDNAERQEVNKQRNEEIVSAGQEGRKRPESNYRFTNIANEQATLYNRNVDVFVGALRRLQSSAQKTLRLLATKAAKKYKLTTKRMANAIYDDGSAAEPHVVQHLSHPDREHVKAAAALLGLQSNAPSLAVFHVDPNGKDALHSVVTVGSGEKVRGLLDEHGIGQRLLLPTDNGWTVVVFDPNHDNEGKMNAFARAIGSPLKTTIGEGLVIGGDRRHYRSILRQEEKRQQEQNNAAVSGLSGGFDPVGG